MQGSPEVFLHLRINPDGEPHDPAALVSYHCGRG
jgi:hypothetical protein